MKHRIKQVVLDKARSLVAARQTRHDPVALSRWALRVGTTGQLERRGVVLADLLEEFGSPLHVVDGVALQRNIAEARSGGDGRLADNVFYSYKSNPVPGVLRRIHAGGIGAEVISEFELWLAMELGVPGDRLIYNGPAKSESSLRTAITHGALLINANTVGEIDRISRAAEDVGRRASTGIRVSLPRMWVDQFGIPSTSSQLVPALRRALADPRLDVIGLHFHRGLPLRSIGDVDAYIGQALEFCDHVRAETGWVPSILDLGGNLTTPTVDQIDARHFRLNRALAMDLPRPDTNAVVRIGEALTSMQAATDAWTAERQLDPIRVVIEPGRALTGDTQLLLTTVLDINDGPSIPHAVLDAGINVAEPTSSEYHEVISASAPTADLHCSYRLVGPICTAADVLYNNWRLPELAAGHVLAVMDSGAYFVPFSTSFSFPRPAIVVHDDDSVELLREAETYSDMVRLDAMRPGDRAENDSAPTSDADAAHDNVAASDS